MKKGILAGLVVCFGLASVASAAISITYATADIGGGLVAATVTASTNNGLITAFEGTFNGGKLRQEWFGGVFKTVLLDDTAMGFITVADDSHYLFNSTDLLTVTTPDETNDLSVSANVGFGDLWGAFGLKPAVQGASVDIAYLVGVAATSTTANVAAAGDIDPKTPSEFTIEFGVIPEPASMALMGVGSLLLLVRRR